MKLCYIADANSIHTRRWIEPFVEQGHTIHLLSYKPVQRQLSGVKMIDLTQITNVRKIRFVYWGWWVRQYVHRLQPDILHAHQVQAAGWLGAMANYHPFVVSGWGSDILVEPHKSVLRRTLVSFVLHRCDELTLPSQLLYNEAKALGFPVSRLHHIPWGVETDIFKPKPFDGLVTRERLGIEPGSQVLFCPRSISPLYNLDIFLKAVKVIISHFNNLTIVLLRFSVNSGYLTKLQQFITENDLEEFVLWLPAQKSPTDMARLYRMADVTVSIPSSEGYGFTVYEAMASGCPTVITDLPVFKGELQNKVHTLKVPVQDIDSTSQALDTLLTNSNLRQEIAWNAMDICQNKSVEIRISKSSILYQKLIEESCHT